VTRVRQRVLVLAIGALILAGVASLSGVAPASAQTPSNGPGVGYPFVTEFPYVAPAPVSNTITFPASVTYPSLTESNTLFPYAAYSSEASLNTIANPYAIIDSITAIPDTRIVGSQTGAYCKDKSGGQVWMPAGAPPDSSLTC